MDNRIKIPSDLFKDNTNSTGIAKKYNEHRRLIRQEIVDQFVKWREPTCDEYCDKLTTLISAGADKTNSEYKNVHDKLKELITHANQQASEGADGHLTGPNINGIFLSYFKPGKEVAQIVSGAIKNRDDMRVTISSDPRWKPSFGELVLKLTHIYWENREYHAEIIALLCRMLVHIDDKPSESGEWHWSPKEEHIERLQEINRNVSDEVDVIETCLIINGICNNEDVKYRKHKDFNNHVGGSNTIRTLIAVSDFLSATSIEELKPHLDMVTGLLGLNRGIAAKKFSDLHKHMTDHALLEVEQPSLF